MTIAEGPRRSQPAIGAQPENRGFVVVIGPYDDSVTPSHAIILAEEQVG